MITADATVTITVPSDLLWVLFVLPGLMVVVVFLVNVVIPAISRAIVRQRGRRYTERMGR